jgi:glycosyltransferase involved in cell wall biosynthesis
MALRLALVHDWLTGMRGGEKCLEVLCREFPDALLATLLHAKGTISAPIEQMQIRTSLLQRIPGSTRTYRYLLPLMPWAVESIRLPAGLDLVVSLSHAVAKGIRVPEGVPHLCYCFTPMRYAWNLRAEYFDLPQTDGTKSGVLSGRFMRRPVGRIRDAILDRVRQWDLESSRNVTSYVAISRTVAGRIRDYYGRDSQIVYPPVDTEFFVPADAERQPYYLCVSALVPYKRIDLAVAAANRLGRPLVVIGTGPMRRQLEAMAGPNVTFAGWRTNEEIRQALRECRALLFPGEEDFGIVPVEAQACGTPVIALGRGGATETVADCRTGMGSGVLFDEPTVDSLESAMLWFEGHFDRFSAGMARASAERFNTARFREGMLACVREAAGIGRRGSGCGVRDP